MPADNTAVGRVWSQAAKFTRHALEAASKPELDRHELVED